MRTGRFTRISFLGVVVAAAAATVLAAGPWTQRVSALGLLPMPDSYSVVQDTVLNVAAPGVLANDTALLSTTAIKESNPAHGTLLLSSNGGFRYTPNPGFVGTDQWRYHPSGCLLNCSTLVTITVTAAPVPTPTATPKPTSTATPQPTSTATPTPTSTATPTPTSTPTSTPAPTSTPGPTPTPTSTPGPSSNPGSTPTPTLMATPTPSLGGGATPTPSSGAGPTPASSTRPGGSPGSGGAIGGDQSPTPSDRAPESGQGPTTGGLPGPSSRPGTGAGAGAGPDEPFALTAANFAPVDVLGGDFGGFAGFDWAIPAVFLTVPGLLLILALLAQATVGFVWLPLVRRRLGEFGFGRRKRGEHEGC